VLTRLQLKVYRSRTTAFLSYLAERFTESGWNVRSRPVGIVDPHPGEQVIMMADLEGPFLATLQKNELEGIQCLTETASSMIWVTCGGFISGQKPEYAMTAGLARVLRSEKQSLELVTVDFDLNTCLDERIQGLLMDILTGQSVEGSNRETEYCVDRGIVYIGRLAPNKTIGYKFAIGRPNPKVSMLKDVPALKGVVQSGKIIFKQDERHNIALKSDSVEIKVSAVGINKEDHLVVAGSDISTAFGHEICGAVTNVSSDVSHVGIGDRVVGFAFDTLSTYQQTPASLVQRIAGADTDLSMATLPMAYATALYGLNDLACIQAGEVVLIIDGCGPQGLAALQLCNIAEAKAVIATSSERTIALLRSSGLPSEQIITPSNEDVLTQVKRATAGQGADVIFCSYSADPIVLRECLQGMAPLGRFVTFGRGGLPTSTISDISTHTRNSTFFSFDLEDLYRKKSNTLTRYDFQLL
jgi:NADPH:quinone reductase-like Zn-dependent oxidoreductase